MLLHFMHMTPHQLFGFCGVGPSTSPTRLLPLLSWTSSFLPSIILGQGRFTPTILPVLYCLHVVVCAATALVHFAAPCFSHGAAATWQHWAVPPVPGLQAFLLPCLLLLRALISPQSPFGPHRTWAWNMPPKEKGQVAWQAGAWKADRGPEMGGQDGQEGRGVASSPPRLSSRAHPLDTALYL